MPEHLFAQLMEQIENAPTYAELKRLTEDCIIAFDQRVRMEDLCAHAFMGILRDSDDHAFAKALRQVTRDKPRWIKYVPLDTVVRQELDIRLLLSRYLDEKKGVAA